MQESALVDEPQDVRTADLLLLPVCGGREGWERKRRKESERERDEKMKRGMERKRIVIRTGKLITFSQNSP